MFPIMREVVANDPEETSLAKHSAAVPDGYEQEFMAGEGTVLYRAKARAHWFLAVVIIGGGGLAILGSGALSPIATIATLAFLTLTYVLFAVLRVTVSQGSLTIQLGLWGPRIPIASIISAEATNYRFSDVGGWGIRLSRSKGNMYNVPGDGGHALRVVWRTEGGHEKIAWVGTREAPQLLAAISEARGQVLPASVLERESVRESGAPGISSVGSGSGGRGAQEKRTTDSAG